MALGVAFAPGGGVQHWPWESCLRPLGECNAALEAAWRRGSGALHPGTHHISLLPDWGAQQQQSRCSSKGVELSYPSHHSLHLSI